MFATVHDMAKAVRYGPVSAPSRISLGCRYQGGVSWVRPYVAVQNAELDDFILLRSDGTPTYMLAVVVDDHDMGVTHVVRGDDHLNNAFRQLAIIRGMSTSDPDHSGGTYLMHTGYKREGNVRHPEVGAMVAKIPIGAAGQRQELVEVCDRPQKPHHGQRRQIGV